MLKTGYLLSFRIIIKDNGSIKKNANKRNDYTVSDSKITFIQHGNNCCYTCSGLWKNNNNNNDNNYNKQQNIITIEPFIITLQSKHESNMKLHITDL